MFAVTLLSPWDTVVLRPPCLSILGPAQCTGGGDWHGPLSALATECDAIALALPWAAYFQVMVYSGLTGRTYQKQQTEQMAGIM